MKPIDEEFMMTMLNTSVELAKMLEGNVKTLKDAHSAVQLDICGMVKRLNEADSYQLSQMMNLAQIRECIDHLDRFIAEEQDVDAD